MAQVAQNKCRCRKIIIVAALVLSASVVANTETSQVTVFVSAPTRNGFVDTTKDIQDSVKDVRTRLKHMKQFLVTDERDGADIVLTVVARGVGSRAYGQRITYKEYFDGATLTREPMVAKTSWVSAIMEVGPYRKEFLGLTNQELAPWFDCADQIAKNLRSWALANAAQMKLRRGSPKPQP